MTVDIANLKQIVDADVIQPVQSDILTANVPANLRRGVKSNLARKPEGNDRAQVKAIWAGECDISLGNTYYMGQMLESEEQTEWANSL